MNIAASFPPALGACFNGAAARAGQSVSLFYVAGRLGQRERSPKWLADYLDQLIAKEGFPPPLPLYRSGKRVATIGTFTRWTRDGVDAWFDGFLPPALGAAVDDQRLAEAAAVMDARAEQMANAA